MGKLGFWASVSQLENEAMSWRRDNSPISHLWDGRGHQTELGNEWKKMTVFAAVGS
jgi:hypothetical protein